MRVLRIVPNVRARDVSAARPFYEIALGLDVLMDAGWIATFGRASPPGCQVSVLSEGGSGASVPALSIEVDDLDEALDRLRRAGFEPEYGPVAEPWGVRRFFVRDSFGTLVNVLSHR